MIPLIASALLGSWTYAGFLDEPAARPLAPAVIVVPDTPPPAPGGPADGAIPPHPEVRPSPQAAVPPAAPFAPPVPRRHQLADARGDAWEHADPVYLRAWIEARNRTLNVPPAGTP